MTVSAENRVLVAVSGSANAPLLVEAGKALAGLLGCPWEAVHVETPRRGGEDGPDASTAEALALASRLGATIATVPAASVEDGIFSYLDDSKANHVVLGYGRIPRWRRWIEPNLVEKLASSARDLMLHVQVQPARGAPSRQHLQGQQVRSGFTDYLLATGLVAVTVVLALLLQNLVGVRPLDLIFLFPVIAIAARRGLGPAILSVALSVVGYNFFLLQPAFSFNPMAPQNLIMTGVLAAVAVYSSILTARMRGRLRLSDRSARENASLAALAQKLTRDADWETTAATVCDHVHGLLNVSAVVYREIDGELVVAGALPEQARLTPVDHIALDWAWSRDEEAGAGTTVVPAADWQFHPLSTTLGTLAVLGIAKADGSDPLRSDQRTLMSTLIAQIALAHERLRLEDQFRYDKTVHAAPG